LPLVFFLKTINSSIPLHLSHLHKISFPILHCSRVAHSCIFSFFSLIYFLFIFITCISLLHSWFYLLKLASSIAFHSAFHELHASSLDITISSSWLSTLQSLHFILLASSTYLTLQHIFALWLSWTFCKFKFLTTFLLLL
jgi:hypothetical protein